MPNTIITPTFSMANTASFRSWGSNVDAAIQRAGLVKTDDTGQLDWNTVQVPGSAGGFAGGSVFRFNDTLHTTRPIHVRFLYAKGGSSGPAMYLEVGKVTNGASGVWPGIGSDYLDTRVTAATVGKAAFASGDGWFSCVIGLTNTSNFKPMCAFLERTKDANGNNTDEGYFFATIGEDGGGNPRRRIRYFNYESNSWVQHERFGLIVPVFQGNANPQANLAGGGRIIPYYPWFTWDKGRVLNPMTAGLCVWADHFSDNSIVDIPMYNQNMKYYAPCQIQSLRASGITNNGQMGEFGIGGNNLAYLMRWE